MPEEQKGDGDVYYLRPGNLWKDFAVEHDCVTLNAQGRPRSSFDAENPRRLCAVLAQATPEEKELYRQRAHPISHTLTQRGRPVARVGDRLIHGARIFIIQGVDEPGELGLWTIYYAKEQGDDED